MSNTERDLLEEFVRNEVTKMFQTVLDYTDIAVIEEDRFKALRGKILGAGNTCIRNLLKELKSYNISYKEQGEDVIVVKQK